jgi:hypothetical protein
LNFIKRMEQQLSSSYPWGYETPSNSDPIATAATPCDPPMAARQITGESRPESRRRTELRLALGAPLSATGHARLTCSAHSGPTVLSLHRAKDPLGPGLGARCAGQGLPDRVVDVGAHRQGCLARVSHSLPPQCPVVSLAADGRELSETRTALVSTQRNRHCALEAVRVASYKKRLHAWGRTWFSWMRVAFCSYPTLNALGPQRARRPAVPCGTNKGGSTPSTPWLWRPSAKEWRSTSSSSGVPSEGKKSWSSSNSCSGTCVVLLSCSGIVAQFIAARWSRIFYAVIPVSIPNTSPPMPQNSTRQSMCGTARMISWPTVHLRMHRTSLGGSALPCANSNLPSRCYGPVSMPRISHGLAELVSLSFSETQ